MVENLLHTAIWAQTKDKVNLCIRHVPENSFSAGDISKFIDTLKIEGYKIKIAFLDYVDTFIPTVDKTYKGGEYDSQGVIVQELRNLSRQYKIPVITATQNSKTSENLNVTLSNQHVGDSYKKVRFSDFIYMCRMDSSRDAFDQHVQKHVFLPEHYVNNSDQLSPSVLKFSDQIKEDLVPFEVKITKSKDAGKDEYAYLLFCNKNLRIYNDVGEYMNDVDKMSRVSNRLASDISKLVSLSISNITSSDFLGDDPPQPIIEHPEVHTIEHSILPFIDHSIPVN